MLLVFWPSNLAGEEQSLMLQTLRVKWLVLGLFSRALCPSVTQVLVDRVSSLFIPLSKLPSQIRYTLHDDNNALSSITASRYQMVLINKSSRKNKVFGSLPNHAIIIILLSEEKYFWQQVIVPSSRRSYIN